MGTYQVVSWAQQHPQPSWRGVRAAGGEGNPPWGASPGIFKAEAAARGWRWPRGCHRKGGRRPCRCSMMKGGTAEGLWHTGEPHQGRDTLRDWGWRAAKARDVETRKGADKVFDCIDPGEDRAGKGLLLTYFFFNFFLLNTQVSD